jgi:3-deoxy-manno-octulosonate cytidylyltransferase (CMP-KDO synthetase)
LKTLIVIPARLASTRLPKKLLLAETGKTLIQHTYEAARTSQKATEVIVAADDRQIVSSVEAFGGNARLTRPDHRSGTDRVAEIAAACPEYDLICNVQGDEPELPGEAIDLAIGLLERDADAVMATLATPIRSSDQLDDPNCVKVVVDSKDRAMYFSRSPLPYPRTWQSDDWNDLDAGTRVPFLQHIGLYVYRRDFLLEIPQLPVPACERIESLEQLRVLHAGFEIAVGAIDHPVVGIDTAEDYAAFVTRQSGAGTCR